MKASRWKPIIAGARALGPYFLLELLMPGGTLFALALWLAQRRREKA